LSRVAAISLVLVSSLWAAAAYPFPYLAAYPNGLVDHGADTASLHAYYKSWVANYYTVCPNDASKARIAWYDPGASGSCNPNTGNCTVSEGIGYGMMITVYADNPSDSAHTMFDRLWAYYQSQTDGNGLMNWQINGCSNAYKTGAATDGDLDVALALSMAYKQWNDSKYLTAAQSILGKIWSHEVDQGAYLFKPDDQGTGNLYDPSYFAVGAARLFQTVDPTHTWSKVADNSLAFLAKTANSTTGLVPDWTDGNGSSVDHNGSGTGNFGYDAVRTPWRVALDYLWFGTPASKSFLDKISTWIIGTTAGVPTSIRVGYTTAGTFTNAVNSVYTGAFVLSGVSDPADTAWIRQGYARLLRLGPDATGTSYFNDSWGLIDLLTLSGNFQNFWGNVGEPMAIRPGMERSASWSAYAVPGAVLVHGTGPVGAELVDARGRILSQATGVGSVSLSRPVAGGLYLVRILGEESETIPVLVD